MKIHIETIEGKKQRYSTSGDYWKNNNGDIEIRISKKSNEQYEWLVLLHEMVEILLTKFQGVSWKEIDRFDIEMDKWKPNDEPGDNVKAPYYHQHQIATIVERLLCEELKIPWKIYDSEVTKGTP